MFYKRQDVKESRRKYITEWFELFASDVLIPWVHRIAFDYKERKGAKLSGMSLLPSYYEDARDKEIAVLAGMLMNENELLAQVSAMRNVLGSSPWEWFRTRGFVEYGTGAMLNKRMFGNLGPPSLNFSKIFSYLYDQSEIFFRHEPDSGLMHFFEVSCTDRNLHSWFSEVYADIPPVNEVRLRWLRASLEDDVWGMCNILEDWERTCPITPDVYSCLRVWLPEYTEYRSTDDAIRQFKFDDSIDFYYACMAYKELSKVQPLECRKMNTVVPRWYKKREIVWPVFWKRRFPWMFV